MIFTHWGCRCTGPLIALVFILASTASAAGGGGSESDDGGGDTMTWISLGLVVVVGGLLVLDVLAGPDGQSVEGDEPVDVNVDTGIEWDRVFPADTSLMVIGVSSFVAEGGTELSRDLIRELTDTAPEWVEIYPDLVELGAGSLTELAGLARSYLGVDILVSGMAAGGEELLLIQAATPDSVVFSGEYPPDMQVDGLAQELLSAAASLRVEP